MKPEAVVSASDQGHSRLYAVAMNDAPPPQRQPRPIYQDVTFQVVVGMALGVAVGALWPNIGKELKPLGDVFIRLILILCVCFCFVCGSEGSVAEPIVLNKFATVSLSKDLGHSVFV